MLTILLLTGCLLLAACGNKGDLYLPPAQDKAQETPAPEKTSEKMPETPSA